MIRAYVSSGLLALAAGAAPAAAEGGAIRGGEHDGFTRIVLTVDPTTEWSLETADGRATLRFPGKELPFSTRGVYDRIPRTRITSVGVVPDPAGTLVTVDLGCDCRVSTSFVGARYLALDVADRRDAGARDPVVDALGGEGEQFAGEAQGGAAVGGLERPFGRRVDGEDDAGEAVVLATADGAAFGGGGGGGAGREGEEPRAQAGADHAARLCLEARSAPASSL